MSKLYRKKPVIIETVQWTGENLSEVLEFAHPRANYVAGTLAIFTLEGSMTVSIGDFIIKGVQGEFYPCKPDIFAETYEAVEGEEQ